MKKNTTGIKSLKFFGTIIREEVKKVLNENKIEIYTGSHPKGDEINKKAFKKLNALLLSDKNPFQDMFQTEYLYLDDTNGFVSIVHSSHMDEHISYEDAKKLNQWIRKQITNSNDVYVYIGDYVFKP